MIRDAMQQRARKNAETNEGDSDGVANGASRLGLRRVQCIKKNDIIFIGSYREYADVTDDSKEVSAEVEVGRNA